MALFTHNQKLSHYHGDGVRILFVLTTALSFIVMPFWGNLLPFTVIAQIGAGIILVVLAGLTSPHNPTVLIIDAVVAGIGVLLLELGAVLLYDTDPFMLFVAREVSMLFMLIALYYSVRTIRALLSGKIREDNSDFIEQNN